MLLEILLKRVITVRVVSVRIHCLCCLVSCDYFITYIRYCNFLLWVQTSDIFMLNALKFWLLRSVLKTVGCSALLLFPFLPLTIILQISWEEQTTAKQKVQIAWCPILQPSASCSTKTLLLSPLIHTNLPSESFKHCSALNTTADGAFWRCLSTWSNIL